MFVCVRVGMGGWGGVTASRPRRLQCRWAGRCCGPRGAHLPKKTENVFYRIMSLVEVLNPLLSTYSLEEINHLCESLEIECSPDASLAERLDLIVGLLVYDSTSPLGTTVVLIYFFTE